MLRRAKRDLKSADEMGERFDRTDRRGGSSGTLEASQVPGLRRGAVKQTAAGVTRTPQCGYVGAGPRWGVIPPGVPWRLDGGGTGYVLDPWVYRSGVPGTP